MEIQTSGSDGFAQDGDFPSQADTDNSAAAEKFLVFTILDRFYTFPSRFISEVAAFDRVYPLPLMPEYVMGIINRYSVPYALLDLGLLIQKSSSPKSKVVVLKEQVDRLAFLIDDVVDIIDIPLTRIMKLEQGIEGSDITEIIESSFEWRNTNVFVLGIRQLLNRIKNDFNM
jgi:purine-binding chemotaxis protein CheW